MFGDRTWLAIAAVVIVGASCFWLASGFKHDGNLDVMVLENWTTIGQEIEHSSILQLKANPNQAEDPQFVLVRLYPTEGGALPIMYALYDQKQLKVYCGEVVGGEVYYREFTARPEYDAGWEMNFGTKSWDEVKIWMDNYLIDFVNQWKEKNQQTT